MHKFKYAMLALAAGVMAQGAGAVTANAMPAAKAAAAMQHDKSNAVTEVRHRGGHFRMHRSFGGHHFRSHRFHGGHFRRHHFGPRIYFYSGSGYSGGCYWLKRRAIVTGSRYWWRRYNACRYGW